MAKDAKGHGSAGKGGLTAQDPLKHARQLEHIRAYFDKKRAEARDPEGTEHQLELADEHGIISHLRAPNMQAAGELADALQDDRLRTDSGRPPALGTRFRTPAGRADSLRRVRFLGDAPVAR